jgi:hypothetical protein
MEEVHLLSLLEKRTCVHLDMTDAHAESGASVEDSIFPTGSLHKASLGKRILLMLLVREEYLVKKAYRFSGHKELILCES